MCNAHTTQHIATLNVYFCFQVSTKFINNLLNAESWKKTLLDKTFSLHKSCQVVLELQAQKFLHGQIYSICLNSSSPLHVSQLCRNTNTRSTNSNILKIKFTMVLHWTHNSATPKLPWNLRASRKQDTALNSALFLYLTP